MRRARNNPRRVRRVARGKRAYRRGLWAEALCGAVLWAEGYKILAHRYHTYCGEIDWVVFKDGQLVIVEVKARPLLEQASDAISRTQKIRLMRAANCFIAHNPSFREATVRFDAMLVRPWRWPRHLMGAWNATL